MKPRAAPVVVAIPARDEADRIGKCLQAIRIQAGAPPVRVVVLANNCTDATARRAREAGGEATTVIEATLPPSQACAGVARRMAMDAAAALAGPRGVLLCTDADGKPDPHWVVNNLRALADGADAVAGMADIDPDEARLIPARLHEDDARECAFAAMLEELVSFTDPDPADPWPRHDQHSGASIAVPVAIYQRAGGIPPVALGEDREFFAALRRIDAAIRHAPDVRVVVSGRTVGRAAGGMADTMRRRIAGPDPLIDIRLEPATRAVRRAALRAEARAAWRSGDVPAALARRLRIQRATLDDALASAYFGVAWEAVEAISPVLVREAIRFGDLAQETLIAARLLERTRRLSAAAGRPAGIPVGVPAE